MRTNIDINKKLLEEAAIKTVGLHIQRLIYQGLTSTIDISPINILLKSQRLRNN